MTETIKLALIAAISAAIGSLTAVFLAILNYRIALRNSVHLEVAKEAIVTLEKNTNSIKDALVKVTGESEHAKGVIQGTEMVDAKNTMVVEAIKQISTVAKEGQ